MINIAGIDMAIDNPDREAVRFIEEYISVNSHKFWLRPSRPGPNAASLTFAWPIPEPPTRINRFFWPTGATRWGFMHLLASSDQVAAVMTAAFADDGSYCPVPLQLGTPDIGPQVGADDSTDNQIQVNMFVLPPTPLSGIRGLSGNPQSLYLLTLVDQRYFWYQNSTGDMQITSNNTWDDVYVMLGNQLNLTPQTFSWDSISSQYLGPSPSMFSLSYQLVPFVLDAAAFNVGQRIVAYYNGSFKAHTASIDYVNLTSDFSANPTTRLIAAGGPRFSPADFQSMPGNPTSLFPQNMSQTLLSINNVSITFGNCGGSNDYTSACSNSDSIGS